MNQSTQQTSLNGVDTPARNLTDEERKEILEQRKLLIDLQNQSSQSFDRTLITLSGGALTISIAFIRQTVPVALPGTTLWLGLSWLFLGLSLAASLFSHFTSQYGLMKLREELDQQYLGVSPPTRRAYKHIPGRAVTWMGRKFSGFCETASSTHFMNVAALFCCVVGLGLLALFVVLNFPQLQVPLPK